MALQDLIRFFVPREDQFFDYLERLGVTAHDAALALATLEHALADDMRDGVEVAEHRADDVLAELEAALARTFVTPLDREDIHALGSAIESVVDYTTHAARAYATYGTPRPSEPMVKLAEHLLAATAKLKETLPALRKNDAETILAAGRELRSIERSADLVFRDAVAALFKDPEVDAKALIRDKEILEDIEQAIDECESVFELLSTIAVKHG